MLPKIIPAGKPGVGIMAGIARKIRISPRAECSSPCMTSPSVAGPWGSSATRVRSRWDGESISIGPNIVRAPSVLQVGVLRLHEAALGQRHHQQRDGLVHDDGVVVAALLHVAAERVAHGMYAGHV